MIQLLRFSIFLCLICILMLQSFYGFTNYKAALFTAAMRDYILFFQILFLYCYKFCGHSDLFIFLRTTICSYDFKSLARSQLIIPLLKIPPMTCPHFGRVTDGITPFYGYSYVVQEFPFPAFASGFIASTAASSPMPS